jgi:hypothetical protein
MYFLVDEKRKVIFGWSAKCGCTHIKTIFNFLNEIYRDYVHYKDTENKLPENIEEYSTILISRNPYERIVSGFLNKYDKNGEARPLWKYPTITFSLFVDELVKNEYQMVDRHHFTPQTSEAFDLNVLNSKSIHCYSIEHIDYSYIESLYNKKIPFDILNKKLGHERKIYPNNLEAPVYDLSMETYIDFNVDTKYFYNDDLKEKVYQFYKQDFLFFEKLGINYFFQK